MLSITNIHRLVKKHHALIATALLCIMFGITLFTISGDSAIVDEVAHIPAGYSYLTHGDYRLNPEHPPLIKDLAALPLLALHLKFPDTIPAWTTDVNGQWEAGWHFLYHDGNNADQILLFSRLPILGLALLLGFAIYKFCMRYFGAEVALLALLFYALSPNILAHDHYVTTDIGIAAFMFLGIWSFVAWLQKPTDKKLMLVAVGGFALAQLAKFSAVLLIPFYIALVVIVLITEKPKHGYKKALIEYGLGLFAIFALGMTLVWLFYIPHTIHMSKSVQDALIVQSLPKGYDNLFGHYLRQINSISIFRPLAQYLLGVLMVINRVQSGNITYFLGDVSNQSFAWYFPVSFLLKTPVSMLIMIFGAIGLAVRRYMSKTPLKVWQNFKSYTNNHFLELVCVLFIIFYSYISITGNLNLGIRHLFPMMPFIFILLAKKVVEFVQGVKNKQRKTYAVYAAAFLAAWYAIAAFTTFPSYLPYINGLFGGSANASHYLSDSNVDWGQDLKRLVTYVNNDPNIDKIAVDYFGGGDPKYYFCKRRYDTKGNLIKDSTGYDCSDSKYIDWHVDNGIPSTKYIAVSETYLVSDLFYQKYHPRPYNYQWLRDKKPIIEIGNSIYIYQVR